MAAGVIPELDDRLGRLDRVPKVELHLHLEGAIPHAALWELIQKYGGDRRAPTIEALPSVFRYRDFSEFIETWLWKQSFVREADDYELIAAAVAEDLARQRIVYTESFFSPADGAHHGLAAAEIALAIRRGLNRVPGVEVALIVDLVRDVAPAAGARTLEEVAEVAVEAGVIGIGIGGSEQLFPPQPFEAVYQRARDLGLRTTAHAGEAAGAESVWGAIRALRVDRIDHATHAPDDPELMRFLAERQIPVTSCPGSNVATGVVASLEEHPIRRFLDAGILVSIGTDDPAMFGLSLVGEYEALVERLGFTAADIDRLMHNAVESCWLPDARKSELRQLIQTPEVSPA
jgi:adenosine deaminase